MTNNTPYLWNGWNMSLGLNGQIQNIWVRTWFPRNESLRRHLRHVEQTVLPAKAGLRLLPPRFLREVGAPYSFPSMASPPSRNGGTGGNLGTGLPGPAARGPPNPPPPLSTNSITIGTNRLYVEDGRWIRDLAGPFG